MVQFNTVCLPRCAASHLGGSADKRHLLGRTAGALPIMLRKLKFPLLYVFELLLWVPLVGTFYGAVSFLASKPIHSLNLQGKSLPAHWEAAVPNHGKYLQGYLVSNHPLAFCVVIAVLLCAMYLLFRVYKEQSAQRQAEGPSGALSHKVAQGCVVAILAGVGYFVLSLVLVGTSAA
jgi:FtsH-binding integral membrane protein